MPPGRKPADRRQRRNADGLGVVEAAPVVVPPAPAGLLKTTRARWDELWGSPMAAALQLAADRSAIERLFVLYDELERATRMYRKARMVKGSMGQPVLNPAAKLMTQLGAEVRQLEDRFGLTPKARVNMGAPAAESQFGSLDDLVRAAADDDAGDPRLTVVPGGKATTA